MADSEPSTQTPPSTRWYDLPRNVWALAGASFCRDVASEMLVHVLPLFLANVLGVGTVVIGLIEGVAETTASFAKVYSGRLSDRLGKRKSLTFAGYGLAALAVPLLLVAHSWPVVAASRFVDRLGKGIRTAPRDALIADSIPAARRGASFGLHRAADSGGAFVGLLLAMWIVWRAQQGSILLDEDTFRTIVAVAIVPAVMAAGIVLVLVRDVAARGGAEQLSLSATGLGVPFRRFLLVMVLFTLGNSSDAFLVLRAQDAGASVMQVLGMIALFNLVYAIAAGPLGALSDRLDRRRLIVGGWLVYAAVYLGFAFAVSPAALWVLYAAYGIYYALTEGVAKAMVADLVPQAQRGTAYGVHNAAIGLTALPASVLAGLLWQGVGPWSGFGPGAPFLFGGALALVSGALLWRWVR